MKQKIEVDKFPQQWHVIIWPANASTATTTTAEASAQLQQQLQQQ
jgi:hypothetical protein